MNRTIIPCNLHWRCQHVGCHFQGTSGTVNKINNCKQQLYFILRHLRLRQYIIHKIYIYHYDLWWQLYTQILLQPVHVLYLPSMVHDDLCLSGITFIIRLQYKKVNNIMHLQCQCCFCHRIPQRTQPPQTRWWGRQQIRLYWLQWKNTCWLLAPDSYVDDQHHETERHQEINMCITNKRLNHIVLSWFMNVLMLLSHLG